MALKDMQEDLNKWTAMLCSLIERLNIINENIYFPN